MRIRIDVDPKNISVFLLKKIFKKKRQSAQTKFFYFYKMVPLSLRDPVRGSLGRLSPGEVAAYVFYDCQQEVGVALI